MPREIAIAVGRESWTVSVPEEKLVELRRTEEVGSASPASPRELVASAMASPVGLEVPIHHAFTPEDRVALVLDESLPRVAELLAGVVAHLTLGGIAASQITVVTPPGGNGAWVEDLPDEFADVTLEAHDPADRKRLGYVATTKEGRRVYLNRTLVEADAIVVLAGRGYDPVLGYTGAESALFPILSDTETRTGTQPAATAAATVSTELPETGASNPEATEVAWLLGTPIYVSVIEGPGNTVAEVVAGLPASTAEAARRQDARWRFAVSQAADLVVAAVAGDPDSTRFLDLAKAAMTAARVVAPHGRVAILSTAAPELEDGATMLRGIDDPTRAAKKLAKKNPPDLVAATLWAFAAGQASLFLASGWEEDIVEELFATPLESAGELQRLIDAARNVLVIPDANKSLVAVV